MSVSIEQKLLSVGLVIAVVATTGSLYFSLGMGLIPCRLCWYQRILMYPLVVVFGVALATNDRTVYQTALPLTGVGMVVSGYHSAIQIIGGGVCGSFSCTTIQFRNRCCPGGSAEIRQSALACIHLFNSGHESIVHRLVPVGIRVHHVRHVTPIVGLAQVRIPIPAGS